MFVSFSASGVARWMWKSTSRLPIASAESSTLSSPLARSWMSSRSIGVTNVRFRRSKMSWVTMSPSCSIFLRSPARSSRRSNAFTISWSWSQPCRTIATCLRNRPKKSSSFGNRENTGASLWVGMRRGPSIRPPGTNSDNPYHAVRAPANLAPAAFIGRGLPVLDLLAQRPDEGGRRRLEAWGLRRLDLLLVHGLVQVPVPGGHAQDRRDLALLDGCARPGRRVLHHEIEGLLHPAEVGRVPLEDRAGLHPTALRQELEVARQRERVAGGGIELNAERVAAVGAGLERRTADRAAVQREVDARIEGRRRWLAFRAVEIGEQEVVLERIERVLLALDLDQRRREE